MRKKGAQWSKYSMVRIDRKSIENCILAHCVCMALSSVGNAIYYYSLCCYNLSKVAFHFMDFAFCRVANIYGNLTWNTNANTWIYAKCYRIDWNNTNIVYTLSPRQKKMFRLALKFHLNCSYCKCIRSYDMQGLSFNHFIRLIFLGVGTIKTIG